LNVRFHLVSSHPQQKLSKFQNVKFTLWMSNDVEENTRFGSKKIQGWEKGNPIFVDKFCIGKYGNYTTQLFHFILTLVRWKLLLLLSAADFLGSFCVQRTLLTSHGVFSGKSFVHNENNTMKSNRKLASLFCSLFGWMRIWVISTWV
jgi:hypothetical protein